PTEEPIDPVRVITNSSSGEMGFAVARAAREAGADVTVISGAVGVGPPVGVARVDVRSAQQMFNEVKAAVDDSDIFVSVAAGADWKGVNPSRQKLKKLTGKSPQLKLVENPAILSWVAARKNPPCCVGFA